GCGGNGDKDGTVRVMMAWNGEEMMRRSGGCDGQNRWWLDFFSATAPKVERGEKVYVCVRVRLMKGNPSSWCDILSPLREPRPEAHGEVFKDGLGLEESVDISFGSDLHELQRAIINSKFSDPSGNAKIGALYNLHIIDRKDDHCIVIHHQAIQIMTSKLPSPMGIKAMLKGVSKGLRCNLISWYRLLLALIASLIEYLVSRLDGTMLFRILRKAMNMIFP
nr:hypothetical protein [Tanacetum cinerariifolium]